MGQQPNSYKELDGITGCEGCPGSAAGKDIKLAHAGPV